jgi:FixJ family two-component response regulator
VLVVDDDPSVRRALERAIRVSGFDVETFSCGEDLFAQGVPDDDVCLVLDLDLPGIGGAEVKRRLDASGHDIPTIFITALTPAEVRESIAALEPLAVLYKPFDRNDLLDAIERASSQYRKSKYN